MDDQAEEYSFSSSINMDMEFSPTPPPYSKAGSPGPLTSTPTKEVLYNDSIANQIDSMTISDVSLVSSIAELEHEEVHFESESLPSPVKIPASIPGYKFIFENIDKTVRPRQMRFDSPNKSLHYVHIYCVKNKINISSLSDTLPSNVNDLTKLLPNSDDLNILKENFAVLVAHVIVDDIPFFEEDHHGLITRHIQHKYSKEMATNSKVVSQ